MPKKRSKIIKDLIMDNINVLQAIESLDFILEDVNNEEIKKWVSNEINGYNDSNDDIVPNYRKANASLIGDVQVGYATYKNIGIPIGNTEAFKFFSNILIKEPISEIMQLAEAEVQTETHALCLDANVMIVNKYQQTNGSVINAHRRLSLYTYNNILGKIKDKLLNIFKELERNYGNLDELYIDFSDINKRDKVLEKLVTIIYNDNSINIGDGNTIENSIIGDENEN